MHINPVGEKELAPLQFQSSSHVPKHVRNAPKRSTLKPYLSSSSFASETISFKSNMLSGSTKILDKSKIADMQKSTEPGSKRPANCLKRPTGKPKRQSLKSRENHWKPKNLIDRYDSKTTIILGDPKGKINYFRGFSMSYSVPKVPHIFQKLPKKEKQRLIDLVPHRMKKTMRLYGVSPLVLLKTRAPNTGPTSKVDSFRKVKYKKDSINELYNELSGDSERSRLNGPEIAPNFGDADEFNTAEDIGLNADLSPEPSDMSSSLANLIEKDNVALDQDFTRDGLKGPEIEPSFGEIDEFEF